MSRDELKQIVSSDLRQLLGAEGEPTFVKYCFSFFLFLQAIKLGNEYVKSSNL